MADIYQSVCIKANSGLFNRINKHLQEDCVILENKFRGVFTAIISMGTPYKSIEATNYDL